MNKYVIGVIIAILAGFGGLVVWSTVSRDNGEISVDGQDPSIVQPANDENGQIGDYVRGKADSKVVLIEYADMMCAGCASAIKTAEALYEEYGDRVAFVFRHYPLPSHDNSRSAAAAVESAGLQGYFWEMVTEMYTSRNSWLEATGTARTDAYIEIFKKVAPDGDVDAFRTGMGKEEVEKRINYTQALGKKHGVKQTPSFFINDQEVDFSEAKTQEDLKNIVKAALDEALKDAE